MQWNLSLPSLTMSVMRRSYPAMAYYGWKYLYGINYDVAMCHMRNFSPESRLPFVLWLFTTLFFIKKINIPPIFVWWLKTFQYSWIRSFWSRQWRDSGISSRKSSFQDFHRQLCWSLRGYSAPLTSFYIKLVEYALIHFQIKNIRSLLPFLGM